jgi:hypothetical protein
MNRFDPEAFGRRLSRELGIKRWDVKRFQQELEKKVAGARMGTSYGSVWSYVNGQAGTREPRRETVEAMASLFGVLPDHLLYGGPRTEAARIAALGSEEALEDQRRTDAVKAVFNERLWGGGTRQDPRGPGPAAQAVLWKLLGTMETYHWQRGTLDGERDESALEVEWAHQVVSAILAPFGALDSVPLPDSIYMDDYVIGACEAIRRVLQQHIRDMIADKRFSNLKED